MWTYESKAYDSTKSESGISTYIHVLTTTYLFVGKISHGVSLMAPKITKKEKEESGHETSLFFPSWQI